MAVNSPHISSYRANHTYHNTSRAIGNLKPFATDEQKQGLLDQFGHHLDPRESFDDWGRPHTKLHNEVRPITFNVMDNHLHKIAHQYSKDGITKLMRRVLAPQAKVFNSATNWRGAVFERFAATPFEELIDPTQIKDMVAYVELNNPILQFETPFAGYQALIGNLHCPWFDGELLLGIFGGVDGFKEHMNRRGPSIVRRKLIEWGLDPRRYPYRPI
ncbi:MAG: hypothetical protein QM648_04445 [Solirubrobacterales bacterium]